MTQTDWWEKPRKISYVVDNESWVLPYVEELASWSNEAGDQAALIRKHGDIPEGDIAFYLGCVTITPPNILNLNHKNIVVHASDLPHGRGFAPVAWQILAGQSDIPFCLIEADEGADTGPIALKDILTLNGTELCDEWRDLQGKMVVKMCKNYLQSSQIPQSTPQEGEGTIFPRRYPKDSEMDINKSVAEQFDLLRVVDNERYPAFFRHRGHRYKILIEKWNEND